MPTRRPKRPPEIADVFATGCEVEAHAEYVRLDFWTERPPRGRRSPNLVAAPIVMPKSRARDLRDRLRRVLGADGE